MHSAQYEFRATRCLYSQKTFSQKRFDDLTTERQNMTLLSCMVHALILVYHGACTKSMDANIFHIIYCLAITKY